MTTDNKLARLTDKVRILEEMLEERSRNSYVESQRRSAINAMLHLSLREPGLDELLNSSLDILLAQDFLNIENRGCVFLANDYKKELTLRVHQNFTEDQAKHCKKVAYGHCLCGQAILASHPLVSTTLDDRHQHVPGPILPHGHCCLPLRGKNEQLGLLCLYLPHNIVLHDEQLEFLKAAADILAGTIQRYYYRKKISTYQADLEEMVEEKIKELHQAENRYRDIFNNSPSGIFQVTRHGKFIECNPALAQMLGYESAAEVIKYVTDTPGQLYDDPEQRHNLLERLHHGPVTNFITKLKRRDGQLIWAQISARLVTNGRHELLEGNIIDISKRKKAELALESEKERLLVTLRSIGDGVISTDANGRVTLLNKVAEKLTGWHLKEALGRPLNEVFHIVNEKTRVLCSNPVEKVLKTGRIVGLANHTALVAKDGSERSIADSGAPIRDHNSEIIGVVLVFRDVTDAHRLEAELQKKRQLESLGVLAGGIAHDFNNILTAILGNINLAEHLIEQDSKPAKLLAQAEKASHRAASLVQQLLTFSKGGNPIKKAASIVEIIQVTTDFILRGSNISCNYQFAEDLWLADIDQGQISQVIQNLVINAKQAMPEGGIITIKCANTAKSSTNPLPLRDGRYIQITVNDQGCGISKSRISSIFDPYFTTKDMGSGLGLAIVHSVIKKHDGHITVKSKSGQGTTFTFYLPASEQMVIVPPEDTSSAHTGNGKILIMDDDEMVREITKEMLGILGYVSVAVNDGQEAIHRYLEAKEAGTPFTATIMDLTIAGGMGGIDTVRELLKRDPEAKVLVASGYGNDPVLDNPRAYGFSGALVKPFQVEDLGHSLAKIID